MDDGYFTEIGDYNIENEKFPKGLNWLFLEIEKVGVKSGIWTAPFFGVKKSDLFKEHSEWFLKKKGTDKYIVRRRKSGGR